MLKLRNIVTLLCLTLYLGAFAQETRIYADPIARYNNGLELYDKEKFAAAITEFKAYIQSAQETEVLINAEFYVAFCHNELNHKDAEQQILNLLEAYPEHPKANYGRYVLGKSYYARGNIGKSLQYLEECDPLNLAPEDRKSYYFVYGYGLFTKEQYKEAREQFQHIEKNKDKYYYPTQYYLGYMDLSEGYDQKALAHFSKLDKSKVYADLAMKYSCLAYYRLGRYQDLIDYSDTLGNTAYAADIFWERGKAYFQLNQAQEALNNFQKGRQTRELSAEDFYMVGMAYYQVKDYENAFVNFTSITSNTSELRQSALMYAGDCFLQLDKKANARNAFFEASRLETDKDLQELAWFNYAKLSLEPPFQNEAVAALSKFIDTYPSSKYGDEAKGYLGEALLSAKKYSDAIPVLESIKNKTEKIKGIYQQICYFYGNELLRQDPQAAMTYFEKARTYPIDAKIDAQVDFWEGEIYYKDGKGEQALKLWERFCANPKAKETPVYADGMYNLAYAYFDKKEYEKASTWFKSYSQKEAYIGEKKPKYIDGMTRLGDCYYISKNYGQAIDAYAYVTSKAGANSDYAWFQTGMIHGIQNKYEEKIVTMKRIPSLYPNSEYVDDALYQIALVDLQRQNYREALRGFSFLLEDYPNGIYAKSSYLNRGLARYNLKMNADALVDYKMVVENYQKNEETEEAWRQIEIIYNEEGRGTELIDYFKTIGKSLSVSYEDSTLYNSALKKYQANNCERAIQDFGAYLERHPNGYFRIQANFYRAECLYAKQDYEKALVGYEFTVKQKFPEFYERSLRRSSFIYLWMKKEAQAIPYLLELEKSASQKDNILYAQVNLMYVYLNLNDLKNARGFAEKVLSNDKAQKTEKRDANLILGHVLVAEEQWDLAKPYFEKVEKDKENKNAKGAEAKFYLALIAYKKGESKKLQEHVYSLDEKYANQVYWVAKGYNLLAESLLDQKDLFNARALLNSIVDSYSIQDDGILEESKRLLQRASDMENSGN